MASTAGTASRLPVLDDVRSNVEQGGLLVRGVQEVVQLSTELGRAIIVSQTPDTEGTRNQVLVDAVGLGPVARIRRDAAGVRRVARGGERDNGEVRDCSQVESCQPSLDQRGVCGGDGVLRGVRASKGAAEGGEGDDWCGDGRS